jgi:spermidine synthase
MMTKTYYLVVTAVAGAAVLALEVLAARLLAPALGSGPVSWAALLATALGMLAVGSLLGGRLSQAARPESVLAGSLTIAAVYLVVLSQIYGPLLRWAAGQPLLAGELMAAWIVQAVPLLALGTIAPVVLHQGRDASGRWGGAVLAAGSAGGIAGALAAGLLLPPAVGLARSLLALAAVLTMTALPGGIRGRRRLAVVFALGLLAAAAWLWTRHGQDRVIQSLHGQLEVRSGQLATTLFIDGLPQTGLPRRLAPGDALGYGYLLELSLAMRPAAKTALVVGLGGGLAPKILTMHGVTCRSIEIDPAVADIARREFQFTGDVILGDARAVVARDGTRYDLIFLDACTADRLPWHLFTLEALDLLRGRLAADGLLVIQFIGDDAVWSASLVRTVRGAFGQGRCVLLAPVADRGAVGPRWLFAGRDRLPQLPGGSALPARAASWRNLELPGGGRLLTDDHFAAELAWAETARRWRGICSQRP